jgi:phage baseplate assembly protein W
MDDPFGTDLSVVPSLVAYDASEVDLTRRARLLRGTLGEYLHVATPDVAPERQDDFAATVAANGLHDLDTLSGRQNLTQALLLRLLTPRGALTALGHAEYGSRLHELIGQRKTDALRNLCRAYVLEVVAQEPRVEDKAVAVVFDPLRETASSFVFTLEAQPRAGGTPVSLGLEVGL